MTFQVSNYWFIGTLILAYYNFLYNCVPLYAANQQGFWSLLKWISTTGCVTISKQNNYWRNVPSNQVLFSFLHLHWYIIQSLFESSKPLSSDQGIVMTGTLHHLHGCKLCLFSFAIWEIHQTSTSMDTGVSNILHMLDASEEKEVITFAAKKKPPKLHPQLPPEKLPLHCRFAPSKGAESEAETSVQSPQALCRSNSLGQDWGSEAWEKMEKNCGLVTWDSCHHWKIIHEFCRRVY